MTAIHLKPVVEYLAANPGLASDDGDDVTDHMKSSAHLGGNEQFFPLVESAKGKSQLSSTNTFK